MILDYMRRAGALIATETTDYNHTSFISFILASVRAKDALICFALHSVSSDRYCTLVTRHKNVGNGIALPVTFR